MELSADLPLPSHLRPPSSRTQGQVGNGIKNKQPAAVQITAEQLLREAWERKDDTSGLKAGTLGSRVRVADADELREYQRNERKTFEMRIVRNRLHVPLWIRYARWEEEQRDFVRARSIWERAIDTDYRSAAIWIQYAEFEMRHRFVNHARNVLDRATALLPRVDTLWARYAHMEEMLQRPDLARNVFLRWLKWLPGSHAYFALIRFELRQQSNQGRREDEREEEAGEGRAVTNVATDVMKRARFAYQLLTQAFPTHRSFLKWAKFEERIGNFGKARSIFEAASEQLPCSEIGPAFFIAFAKFEERRNQIARARAIYQYAIANENKKEKRREEQLTGNKRRKVDTVDALVKDVKGDDDDITADDADEQATLESQNEADAEQLENAYSAFEKQHGDTAALDVMLLHKRRVQLEGQLKTDVHDYDAWFELIQLEERASSPPLLIRQTYERAVKQVPTVETKAAWSRYIYLWLLYAAWTELNEGGEKNSGDEEPSRKGDGKSQGPKQDAEPESKTIQIYRRCIATVPFNHARFSFAKLWLQYAHAHVRRGDLASARRVFGTAIGVLPKKHRLYEEYAQLECAIGEIERARDVFCIWLARHPSHANAFVLLADLELRLGEHARALAVLELGTATVVAGSTPLSFEDTDVETEGDEQQGKAESDDGGSEIIWSKLARTVASVCDREDSISRFERYVSGAETEDVNEDIQPKYQDSIKEKENQKDEQLHRAWAAYVEMMMAANNDQQQGKLPYQPSDIRKVFGRAFNALRHRSRLSRGGSHQQTVLSRLLDMGQAWVAWESSLRPGEDPENVSSEDQDRDLGKTQSRSGDKNKDDRRLNRIDTIKQRLPQKVSSGGHTILQLPDESGQHDRAVGSRLLAAAMKWKSVANVSS